MKTYTIQFRRNHNDRLITFDLFYAKSELGAIRQAVGYLARMNEPVVEIIATENEE